MNQKPTPRYLIWTNYGCEGWKPDSADTWEDAVKVWRNELRNSYEVILTEVIPVQIVDGREPKTVRE